MRIFSKLFGKQQPPPKNPEHAVIIHFNYGSTDLQPLHQLEDQLIDAIAQAAVGEYDGHEIAVDGRDGNLYMYGPDGDQLYQTIQPTLTATPFMPGATVIIRYGPPQSDVQEKRFTLSSQTGSTTASNP